MAEPLHPNHPAAGPEGDPEASARAFHDGRFGETFDAEIDVRSVVWVAAGIFAFTVVGMAIAWGIYQAGLPEHEEGGRIVGAPSDLVSPSRVPEGPLLQMHPEEELRAMREEMRLELETWRWADERAGTVTLPIDFALERVAAQGLPARTLPPAAEALAAKPSEERDPALRPSTTVEVSDDLAPTDEAPSAPAEVAPPAEDDPPPMTEGEDGR